jgi:hypothetical protein
MSAAVAKNLMAEMKLLLQHDVGRGRPNDGVRQHEMRLHHPVRVVHRTRRETSAFMM